MKETLTVSDIARSLAGHDGGRLFVVVGSEDEYVLLADGKERKLQRPKRKKRKHAVWAGRCDSPLAERLQSGGAVQDSEIRRALARKRALQTTEEGVLAWQKMM